MKTNFNEEPDIASTLGTDPFLGKKKGRKPWLVVAALVVVVVVIVIVVRKKSDSAEDVRYKTQEVRRGDITVIVTATGTLQPTNKVEVGSELSGIIKTVNADYNSKVKVGQILAKLDTSKLEAQVTQSKATLESAKAMVLQSQATVKETRSKLAQLQRVRELSNGRSPSQVEIDAAEAAFDRAIADVASNKALISQAQATLDANLTDLSKAVIRSPINGIVLIRGVEPGQTVAASFTTPVLFKLAEDLTKMELHVDVDEADVGKIQEGQLATFSVAAYPNRTFDARIIQARYGSTTTSGVVTYETVLKVDNPDLSLRPGMTATADIIVRKNENTLLIPSAALRFIPSKPKKEKSSTGLLGAILPHPPGADNQQSQDTSNKNENQIWVLKDGKLSAVPITIGSASGSMTEVIAGDIQPGTVVVVDTVVSSVK